MKLSQIATTNATFPVENLSRDASLAKEIQGRLIQLGCLDPPADGKFGPVSRLTLGLFAKRMGLRYDEEVTGPIANALLKQTGATFIPLKLGSNFASRIVTYLQLKDYFVARLPGFLNIVYVEGADADGKANPDAFDKWNDRRIIVRIDAAGKPVIDYNALATTEPGKFFTIHPLNTMGAARIAFDQFKAWHVGTHHPSAKPPRKHEALVQAANIRVFRDKNKDGSRKGDAVALGSGMGINQHSGLNASVASIGKVSAGCLVARSDADHKLFMKLVKKDPRFAVASKGYLFISTIIAGDDLAKKVP
jgi:hypothetical protein